MRISITLYILLSISTLTSFSQKFELPKLIGTEVSFQDYISSSLANVDTSFLPICDTSMGLIQFTLNKEGIPDSITISEGFPKEISAKLYEIVSSSRWSRLKSKNNAGSSSPIVLPIAICIEAGCADGYIKRGFGFGGDFARMFPQSSNALYLNCILLEPLTYTVQKGN